LKFDDSIFLHDISFPDGSIVKTNSEFEKIWEIKNNGCIIWKNRFLIERNSRISGLIPEVERIPIKTTYPGETIRIKIKFKTPEYPAGCISEWKMVDEFNEFYFPKKKGLFCKIQVEY